MFIEIRTQLFVAFGKNRNLALEIVYFSISLLQHALKRLVLCLQIGVQLFDMVEVTNLLFQQIYFIMQGILNNSVPFELHFQVRNHLGLIVQILNFFLQFLILLVPLRAVLLVDVQLLVDVLNCGFSHRVVLQMSLCISDLLLSHPNLIFLLSHLPLVRLSLRVHLPFKICVVFLSVQISLIQLVL